MSISKRRYYLHACRSLRGRLCPNNNLVHITQQELFRDSVLGRQKLPQVFKSTGHDSSMDDRVEIDGVIMEDRVRLMIDQVDSRVRSVIE